MRRSSSSDFAKVNHEKNEEPQLEVKKTILENFASKSYDELNVLQENSDEDKSDSHSSTSNSNSGSDSESSFSEEEYASKNPWEI